ncbi:hypothetical protein LCGC14_2847250 [marine sediment metagenome]|uniref:Uncharacterized protein n=1 Tax=marine sediment metagenome TaxID=412755 RepID=A0A0F8Y9K9_9ZZZZ
MKIWILDHIEQINTYIRRLGYLVQMTEGEEKEKLEKITKVLNDQKITLQKIVRDN